MLSGLSILCFAACYAAALILEIARPVWPAPARRALEIGFVTAGLFAQTWYLAARAVAAEASPLSSPHDWYLLAAWALAAVYFYLEAYYPQASVGLFVLPLMLGLIGAAHFADREPFAVVRASRFWGNVHGASLLLGTVTVMAGFVAGLMYLLQSYRLKHKMLSPRFRLPSLEWLERVNSRAILTSVLFIGVGFLSGVVLNRVEQRSHLAEIPWYDPVILSLAGMLLWLLAAAAFNLLYRAARRGRKVAYLTVASFGFLMIVLGVLLFVNTEHGARTKAEGGRRKAALARVATGCAGGLSGIKGEERGDGAQRRKDAKTRRRTSKDGEENKRKSERKEDEERELKAEPPRANISFPPSEFFTSIAPWRLCVFARHFSSFQDRVEAGAFPADGRQPTADSFPGGGA